MSLAALTKALRETGHAVCIDAADRLERSLAPDFNLHLRSAGLIPTDAAVIAEALAQFDQDSPCLRSFSVSYNPTLGDVGVKVLLAALPATVNELGMVGCELSDDSGQTLLEWAKQADGLRMMCVEGNRYSEQMRGRLSQLGGVRSMAQIYV